MYVFSQLNGFCVVVTLTFNMLIRCLLIVVFQQLIIKVIKHPIEHKMSAVICKHIKKGECHLITRNQEMGHPVRFVKFASINPHN